MREERVGVRVPASLISRARAETRRGRREKGEGGGTGIGGWENEIWELWGVLGRKGGGDCMERRGR